MRFVKTVENLFGLPQGFTRVEFLESTNQQNNDTSTNNVAYIDTGVLPDDTTKIECRVQFTTLISGNSNEALFGTTGINSSNPARMAFGFASLSPYTNFYMGLGIENLTTSVTRDTNAHIFTIDASTLSWKIDNTTGTFSNPGRVVGDGTMYLFARNYVSYEYANKPANAKLYYFKIWKNGVLVRDMIPCLDPLGVACMYDLVGKKPYYNQGTGTFTTGRKIIPVEYLESSSGEYIATGVTGGLETEVVVDAEVTGYSSNNTSTIFGNISGSIGISILLSSTNTQRFSRFGSKYVDARNFDLLNKRKTIISNKNSLTVGDTSLSFNETSTFSISNLALFNIASTTSAYYSPMKVYSCQIKDNGTLVRDFIPCKDENNVGFMFNKLSGTAYLNSGTGAFSVGENKYKTKLRLIKDNKLPAGYMQVEYLEGTGTQYIDTGLDYFADFEVGIQLRNNVSNKALGNDGYNCLQRQSSSSPSWQFMSGSGNYYNSTVRIVEYHVMKWKDNKIYADDVLLTELTKGLNTPNRMRLYSANGSNVYPNVIYFCKLWNPDNGELVRDFIPALDQSGTPCMYDMVSKTPFYNAGTGTFTTGKPVLPMVRFIKDIIPREYAAVNYIESTGTQYIDTGINANSNPKYELKFVISYTNPLSPSPQYTGADSGGTYGVVNGNWLWSNNVPVTANQFYEIDYINQNGSRGAYVNGTDYYQGNHFASVGYRCLLFTAGQNSSGTNKTNLFSAKMKSCSIILGDTLVRNFIPVVRRIDKVAGMWDTVTKQFFGNSGTGNFNYG